MSTSERVASVCDMKGLDIHDPYALSEADSLTYISIIVGLEEEFSICFPDDALVENMLMDLPSLYKMIENLQSDNVEIEEDNDEDDDAPKNKDKNEIIFLINSLKYNQVITHIHTFNPINFWKFPTNIKDVP